jgi:hypothetical protein
VKSKLADLFRKVYGTAKPVRRTARRRRGFEVIEPRWLLSAGAGEPEMGPEPSPATEGGYVDIGPSFPNSMVLSGTGAGAGTLGRGVGDTAAPLVPVNPLPASVVVRENLTPLTGSASDSSNPGSEGGFVPVAAPPRERFQEPPESIAIPSSRQPQRVAGAGVPSAIPATSPQIMNNLLKLQAARGRSQAFELAAAGRGPETLVQRVTPPKPLGLVGGASALVAARSPTPAEGTNQATTAEESGDERHRDVDQSEAELAALNLAALLQPALTGIDAVEDLSTSADGQKTKAGANNARDNLPLPWTTVSYVRSGKQANSEYSVASGTVPVDFETAARTVGLGLIVIVWQAGAMYFSPEQPAAHRTPTRDWEIDLDPASPYLPLRVQRSMLE